MLAAFISIHQQEDAKIKQEEEVFETWKCKSKAKTSPPKQFQRQATAAFHHIHNNKNECLTRSCLTQMF